MNEYSLHNSLKTLYSLPGDQFEAKLGNYFVDILRGDSVIEIQTKNFSALKEKLHVLTKNREVRIVYPLPQRKWITYITKDHEVLKKRKSPVKGRLTDVFRELIMIPNLIGKKNFSLEVLFIDEEEVRCADGRGSWRRKGVSVIDRRLLGVDRQVLFQDLADYLKVLPESLNEVFTNREIAELANIPLRTARQITYCLRKSGALRVIRKKGNTLIFQRLV